MGVIAMRSANPVAAEQKKEQRQELLDAQEVCTSNAETAEELKQELEEKNQQILDLQEILVIIAEGGTANGI